MRSHFYDRLFLAPDGDHGPRSFSERSKISIAWWLVPSMVVYLVVSAAVFA